MAFNIRHMVALAELIAAIDAYKDALMGFDDEDDYAELIETPQIAIARALLRLCDLPAGPNEVFGQVEEGALQRGEAIVQELADRYRKSPIPSELRWQVFRRDSFTCKGCGLQAHLEADHVIPESKGGPTTLENLQTLCRDCNRRKGDRA